MHIRKILAVYLSALLFATSDCSVPDREKAVSSDSNSMAVSSLPPASLVSSSSLVSAAAPSAQSSGTGVSQSVGKWVEKAPMSTPRFACGSAVVGGKIYQFGGLTTDNYHCTASAEVYDPGSNQWKKIKPMTLSLHDMHVAVLNGEIYSIGGIRYNSNSYGVAADTVERYDPAADTWTDLKPMSVGRSFPSLAMLDGKIYAIGGEAPGGDSKSREAVEAYDPTSDTWVEKASMLFPWEDFETAVVNGKIYLIGGMYSVKGMDYFPNAMEMYDPVTNQWTKKAAMHVNRNAFYVETVGGKIYVIGGWNPNSNGGSIAGVLTSVEEYDPATDRWTIKAPMIEKKGSFQTAVLNGKIDVIGGWNDIKYTENPAANFLSSVQEYDPQTDKWTEKSPLKMGRSQFKTAVVGNSIYAIGGTVGPDAESKGTNLVEEYTATK